MKKLELKDVVRIFRNMKIRVSKDYIKNGKRKNASSCPVALAAIDEVKKHSKEFEFESISVYQEEMDLQVRVQTNGQETCFINASLPVVAQNFIETYDGEEPVKPIRFTLKKVKVTKDEKEK